MSYGISYTSGSLIPSFCLSIKGRHDAPKLSLCSDGLKSDLALYVFVNLSVPFSTLWWTSSWISQLSSLCCLWLPMNIRNHLLWVIGYSICQNCIEDSYQLTADGNHGLFLLERIVPSGRVILMQWLKLRVLSYQRNRCIEQYCS